MLNISYHTVGLFEIWNTDSLRMGECQPKHVNLLPTGVA